MRFPTRRALIVSAALSVAAPVHAQRGAIDLAADMLDRWLNGYAVERTELAKTDSKVAELDDKIKKWRDCKSAWEMAGEASGSRLGGFAARMAIKARCGTTSDEDWVNDRRKILEGPEVAGAKAGNFKREEYASLRDRIIGYIHGDRSGFTQSGLDLLASRQSDLTTTTGMSVVSLENLAGAGGGRGMAMPGVWTNDYAWSYIGVLFAYQYSSGATMFEKPYQPGQWTKWEMTSTGHPDDKQSSERAFIGKGDDNTEWWRMKTIVKSKDKADTIVLEAQFRNMDQQSMKQLVRMRGKLPGSAEPQELMVPQYMTMLPTGGAFPFKPTKESIDGATVGTESITTPAGTFNARHVRFGGGGGTIDWWLSDDAPGGWVKFGGGSAGKSGGFQMILVGSGTGARSELGVKVQ